MAPSLPSPPPSRAASSSTVKLRLLRSLVLVVAAELELGVFDHSEDLLDVHRICLIPGDDPAGRVVDVREAHPERRPDLHQVPLLPAGRVAGHEEVSAHVRLVAATQVHDVRLRTHEADAVQGQGQGLRKGAGGVVRAALPERPEVQLTPWQALLAEDVAQLLHEHKRGHQRVITSLVGGVHLLLSRLRGRLARWLGQAVASKRRDSPGSRKPVLRARERVHLVRHEMRPARSPLGARCALDHEVAEALECRRRLQAHQQLVCLCQILRVQRLWEQLQPRGLELLDALGQVTIEGLEEVQEVVEAIVADQWLLSLRDLVEDAAHADL
mmetsp:Transcript_149315/g.416177  ORF Transcript_149315/g.416177 Transcript_149315/m.416177 type:complete len:327 (-) Transcript_149315:843-1823(-)